MRIIIVSLVALFSLGCANSSRNQVQDASQMVEETHQQINQHQQNLKDETVNLYEAYRAAIAAQYELYKSQIKTQFCQ